ncbi:glycosyltransferase [Mediterraneibacter gnavus]|jgi:glycosyltransferase involved in cell wall biosynthesis|uniref:Glycosyltransferase n=1 Tax=Mediterraneibacter gnavus TaxID=33038 RepID=A0A414UR65_MEDGN|nr:glycosyltransferase [Mediterraneibacter gnavus]RHG67621.1 glycosyltransferase [Mediterraneibacter gnavus]RHG79095.1 glycosyltransferase [Mediterraneibacter gnavus]
MKIVQINAVYEYSSTGRIVKELSNYISSKGHESYVFCTNTADSENNIFCVGTKLGRKIHGIFSRITGLQGYFSTISTKKVLKQLSRISPDIAHLHNLHANYINVNLLLDYLIEKQIPVVITLHDCWFFTGHCCHYLEDGCDRWKTGCGNCPAKHKWNKSWFFDQSGKVYSDRLKRYEKLKSLTVVGVSDWITNESKLSMFKNKSEFCRIYNWIDLNQFSPKAHEVNKRKRILSVSQSWSDIKGLSDIINIAQVTPEFDFVMVGEMPSNIALPDNVKAVGVINNLESLVAEYQNADLFLHLSYQETFGKVIAESLACGTPAVVYDVTAMPELIGDGCGAVVSLGDWKAASDAIQKVEHYRRDKCRKYAEENFDMNKLLQQWLDLYNCIKSTSEGNS